MHIKEYDWADVNFPVKSTGVNIIALHGTVTYMSCMIYVCYMKPKDLL